MKRDPAIGANPLFPLNALRPRDFTAVPDVPLLHEYPGSFARPDRATLVINMDVVFGTDDSFTVNRAEFARRILGDVGPLRLLQEAENSGIGRIRKLDRNEREKRE
jgi:hypothetical protein